MICMTDPVPMTDSGGYWTTWWFDEDNCRRWKRFGSASVVPRREAQADYQSWLLQWHDDPLVRNPKQKRRTVRALLRAYYRHARSYYQKPDGRQTGEASNIKDSLRFMLRVCRGRLHDLPVARVRPAHLKLARAKMIKARLARTTINQRVAKIRACFKWGVEKELVPASVWHSLCAVKSLSAGRSKARETESVHPVPDDHLRRAYHYMPRPVRAMVRLQLYSGCRPSEACNLRACELDTSGTIWTYTPGFHKTSWRGKTRTIYLGPRAQRVLRAFWRMSTSAYLFDPRDVCDEVFGRTVGDHYDRRAYYQAVVRACGRAGVPVWSPNQLRHNAATYIRKEYGVEMSRVILGHSSLDATGIYAEQDRLKAISIVGKVG